MKFVLIAFSLVVATPVFAQTARPAQPVSTSANVPTGYQVKGCLNYKLVNGAAKEVCFDKMHATDWMRESITPGSPVAVGSGTNGAVSSNE